MVLHLVRIFFAFIVQQEHHACADVFSTYRYIPLVVVDPLDIGASSTQKQKEKQRAPD